MPWTLFERELSRDPFAHLFRAFRDAASAPLGAPVLPTGAPLNVWVSEEDILVHLEVPGVRPEEIEVSLEGPHLRIRGQRKPRELGADERFHRRERSAGTFERYVQLPYRVDADRVEARCELGVLEVRLPRAESDKPRTIEVRAAAPQITTTANSKEEGEKR